MPLSLSKRFLSCKFAEVILSRFLSMKTALEPFLSSMGASLSRKKGQTLVEYSLILAIISVVMISVMSLLGTRIVVVFSAITNLLDTAQSSQ
jgi:Flp pilus assembly pilin Flp